MDQQNVSNMKHSLLVRHSSCHSLVEIPTFVTGNILLRSVMPESSYSLPEYETNEGISLAEKLAEYQPIIEEETEKNKQLMEKHLMCMATMFCLVIVLIVGTMFAVTSQYQDSVVANMINMSNHHNKIEIEAT